ncbi:amidase [Aquariibacter lacus]|uniref:amidase n=1 Tax=Aquariibacter lacus TaxID=2801332 RepID=UPI0025733642|nr:amidase [Piscinibacter lacus]
MTRPDLCDALARLHPNAPRGAQDALAACLHAAADPEVAPAFLQIDRAGAQAAAQAIDQACAAGQPRPPLGGLAVVVKDLFDVAGQTTAGGSRRLAGAAPAGADAPAVARLRAAGAVLIGRAHMNEFAYSGVGLNPHHPVLANPATARLEPGGPRRVPGGSSSGSAAAVAGGAAWAGLGSDTGGSLRIPAALQGLVGFKPTQSAVPREGMLPLAPTLDTVGAITRSVRDAALLDAVLRGAPLPRQDRPLAALRLGLPETLMLEALDPRLARGFEAVLARLRAAGARIEPLPLPELGELAAMNALGGFPAAEAWAWHRQALDTQPETYDPRVAARIRRGASQSAADYLALQRVRADWIRRVDAAITGFDALLSPTVPDFPPPLDPLLPAPPGASAAEAAARDAAFFALNARLLRNPTVVNLLDGCAISLPAQAPGELPWGLMLWAGRGRDATLLDAARAVEAALDAEAQEAHA